MKGHVVPAAVMDARDQAAEIVAAARRQADAMLAEAEGGRERVRREAYDLGRAQAAAELADVLTAGRAHADELLARARPAALAVAAKMAEKIVGRAVALAPDVMVDIASEALAACQTRAGAVALRVHPDHLPAVEPHRAALAARLGGEAALVLVADETVERLGCVVDTPVGRVDARLATLLARLTEVAGG